MSTIRQSIFQIQPLSTPVSQERKQLQSDKHPKTATASVRLRCSRKQSPGETWAGRAEEPGLARSGAERRGQPRGAGARADRGDGGARSQCGATHGLPGGNFSPRTLSATLSDTYCSPGSAWVCSHALHAESCSEVRCSQAVLSCSTGATST